MRLKDYAEKDGKRVWLSEREIQQFIGEAENAEQRAAFLLGVRSGLRREEITDVVPAHVHETEVGRVVRIWEGKGDKYREVPISPRLATIIETLSDEIEPDDSVVDVDESTVYRWVQRAGERLYSETGDKGWTFLGPHDLRRTWGVRLLEAGTLPSVVFEWGGWEDWQTFRDHYLAEFSPEAIRRERAKVDWLREPTQRASDASGPGVDYDVVTSGDWASQ